MKRITDKDFVYTNAASTDVSKTIAREKKRLAKLEELKAHFNKDVVPIMRKVAK